MPAVRAPSRVAWLLLTQPDMTTFALPPQGPVTAVLVSFPAERLFGCLAAVAIVWLLVVVVMVARARPAGPRDAVGSRRRMSAAGRAPRTAVPLAVAGGGLR